MQQVVFADAPVSRRARYVTPAPSKRKVSEREFEGCRRLWCSVLLMVIGDAVYGQNGLTAPIATRMRAIAKARRELLHFARNYTLKANDIGQLCDLTGMEREAIALALVRRASEGWPVILQNDAQSVKNPVLPKYVSNDGEYFYCPKPKDGTSLKQFALDNPEPQLDQIYKW